MIDSKSTSRAENNLLVAETASLLNIFKAQAGLRSLQGSARLAQDPGPRIRAQGWSFFSNHPIRLVPASP